MDGCTVATFEIYGMVEMTEYGARTDGVKLIATATGVIEAPSELYRLRWLIPDRDYRIPGDRYACHIDAGGLPLCGVELSEPYRTSEIRCAYYVCPACEEAQRTGQGRLL